MPPQAPIDDSRLDLPSASSIERYVQCPRSLFLERANPGESSSAWAARGTRIHDANERGDVSDLVEDEADIVVRNRQCEERLYNQWMADFNLTSPVIYREYRVYITHNLEPIASVKMDLVAIACDQESRVHALVLDLKSGRLEVSTPAANWQLRTGAVACYREWDADHVRVAITQPLRKEQPPCDYTRDTLTAAFLLLQSKLNAAKKPDAELNMGAWCQYCKARHLCPKVKEVEQQLVALKEVSWGAVPVERKPELFKRAKLARKLIDDLIEKIEAEVDEGKIPGLMRGPGSNVRSITDPIELYSIMRRTFGEKITPEKFAEITDVKIGKATKENPNKGLEDLVRESAERTEKGKEITWAATKEWIADSCAPVITTKQKKGPVVEVKEVKEVTNGQS